MSKTTIFLILLVIGAAIPVAIFTDFLSEASIRNFIENPASILPSLTKALQFIKQNVIGFITGTLMAFVGLAKFVSSRIGQSQQNVSQVKTELSAALAQATTEKEAAETKLKETTETYSENFKAMSENYVKLQDHAADLEATTKQLSKQLADERVFFQDKIRKLETEKIEAGRVA